MCKRRISSGLPASRMLICRTPTLCFRDRPARPENYSGSTSMVRDRDRIYGAIVTRRLRAMGIRGKPIAPASFAWDRSKLDARLTNPQILLPCATGSFIRRSLRVKFPVPVQKFPHLRNIFAVNVHRELFEKPLRHSGFLLRNRRSEP